MQMQAFARGALAVTAVAAVMAVAPAHAELIYSGPVSIAVPDNIDGVYVNLVTGAANPDSFLAPGWDINPYSATPGNFNLWGATTTTWMSTFDINAGYVLSPGTSISSSDGFFRPGGNIPLNSEITLNGANLFGVQFANESTGGANNYGWVEVTFGATAADRAITGWAYDNTGAGVMAGVVPEPGTYALMLAGLVAVGGIAARRRKA